jgi:hypothetical protein
MEVFKSLGVLIINKADPTSELIKGRVMFDFVKDKYTKSLFKDFNNGVFDGETGRKEFLKRLRSKYSAHVMDYLEHLILNGSNIKLFAIGEETKDIYKYTDKDVEKRVKNISKVLKKGKATLASYSSELTDFINKNYPAKKKIVSTIQLSTYLIPVKIS